MKQFLNIFLVLALFFSFLSMNARIPCKKEEFRGAWLHTVYQGQYARQTTAQNQAYLRSQLDSLRAAGVNAVIFQVRPSADAFYSSTLEPWSRFLTGTAGQAPRPAWDPLEFMVREAHARGMELHAWLNPYRVTTAKNEKLPANHIYHKFPGRFVKYADGKIYFNPGIPENREFITRVVKDIVTRYDVDGIHFDDYFYPYPVANARFQDDAAFKKYGNGMTLADWRRHNVDMLIKEVYETVREIKPWVRFGVSPFGIWRNKRSDPQRGSMTNGLENYDSLYADVLLWASEGWVDYLLPQVYWPMNHKSAAYKVLTPWWNENASGRHVYIGQDVERTVNACELAAKLELQNQGENIQGLCWWPGYYVSANKGGIADSLAREFHPHIALVPSYPWISTRRPQAPRGLRLEDGTLHWDAPAQDDVEEKDRAARYVVYRFDGPEQMDLSRPEAIQAVVPGREFKAGKKGVYVVTALSRANVEGEPASIRVR